ncbi:RE1-silencing transcription factor [Hyla sarda]|uniref:RE1-silencing transcription factor n=1 Tax=Hyla sarda TaxID=327740 RepID=UPI0024C2A95F|nr:RE1-silencing transcription factor [Hyla sarda]XP_056425596.1 RE1-silencing transcription factor [Hyla sarda]
MATQMVSQPSGSNLFNSGSFGMGDMYGLHDLSKAEMAAPRLIMLANVALTGEVPNGCCDYSLDEDRQMAELKTVYENSFSDSDGERMELEESNMPSESDLFDTMDVEPSEAQKEKVCDQPATTTETRLEVEPEKKSETPPSRTEEKTKCVKSKPFRCRPCQYKAESEEEFVHHIKDHSAKRFIDHDSNKNAQDSGSSSPEEVDFSKGPIRCDRCGYNTNRFDHYLAHLKHHNKASDNERVYKCTICTYTTVSEYHWKKHLRNHFPRIVYTCSQCSYFSDRKNNYIQHIRTHTGERPYQCVMCPYSSSQKTHLTRHMRTHSGEKPFKCEQCSYVASNQHEVTRHARQVHNGPKPLTCPHCNYKTADRSNFKKHVELHVNPRQFLCPVCDYAASKKCNLQYHIKSRHSGCADITMDVSKVKLRTKKGDAGGSDVNSNKREAKESSAPKNEPPEKKSELKPKVDKEKCAKVKQAATPPVGQITTRSHKPPSSKTEEDANPDKGKCAKRKSSVLSEKPLKKNDTQITNVKKRRLAQKRKHTQDVRRKVSKAGKTEKRKAAMKKANHKKPLKNKTKKMISHKTAISKNKSKKSTTNKDAETKKSKSPIDDRVADDTVADDTVADKVADDTISDDTISDDTVAGDTVAGDTVAGDTISDDTISDDTISDDTVAGDTIAGDTIAGDKITDDKITDEPLAEQNPESSTEPMQEEGTSLAPIDGSDLGAENKVEESTVSDVPIPDPNNDLCSSTSEITPESDQLLLEKDSDINKDSDPDRNSVTSPLPVEPVLESPITLDTQLLTITPPAEAPESIPEVACSHEVSGLHCSDSPSEESVNESTSNNSSQEESGGLRETNPSDTEQCLSTTITQNINDCDPKESVHTPCEATSHEPVDIEEDEGIHSHEGSDISDNVSERSDDSGLNGLQSPQETLESQPLLEVPSVSTSVSNESFVCIFCDRVFKKAEEYTKHLKRHLVNVYYLEKAAQNQL